MRNNKQTKLIIAAAKQAERTRYVLWLYVAGLTPRSAEAIRRVSAFCDKHLRNRHDLMIVDIYQNPALTRHEQIIAAPTLVKQRPAPFRRLIGDMSSEEKLLSGLDLNRGPMHVLDQP
jgi:circadian clock protein KaiB